MDLDDSLVQDMRDAADHGATVSQLILLVGHRLGLQGTNFRLLAIAYLRAAFRLSLRDAGTAGALSVFPDGNSSESEIDQEMAPMIESTRKMWSRDRTPD